MTTNTRTPRNRSRKPACGRALADYRFLGCLERTAATETWEARAPEGKRWIVKVLFNVVGTGTARLDAVRRLQALKHPGLVPTLVQLGGPGCLVVASEFPETTLLDRMKQEQVEGLPGIPRASLLEWLRTAAVALDDVAKEQGLAHLGLTPRHLQLAGDTVLVAEHGLTQLMWLPTGQFQGQVQPRYAAPELPDPQHSGPASDQFSLAAIFQELLTGTPPFRKRPAGFPDLAPLADSDRAIIHRALDFDPKKRYSSCVELIDVLTHGESVKAVVPTAALPEAPAPAVLPSHILSVTQQPEAPTATATPAVPAPVEPTPPPECAPDLSDLTGTIPIRSNRTNLLFDLGLAGIEPLKAEAPAEPLGSAPKAPMPEALEAPLSSVEVTAVPPTKDSLDEFSSLVELDSFASSEDAASVTPPIETASAPIPEDWMNDHSSRVELDGLSGIEEETPDEEPFSLDVAPTLAAPEVPQSEAVPETTEMPILEAPAPPVAPTWLLNEEQPAPVDALETMERSPFPVSPGEPPAIENDNPFDLSADTVPFHLLQKARAELVAPPEHQLPVQADDTPVQDDSPASATETPTPDAADSTPTSTARSPFDPDFVPAEDHLGTSEDWTFPASPAIEPNPNVDQQQPEAAAVAVDNQPDEPAVSSFTAPDEPTAAPAFSDPGPEIQSFNIPLRTAKLMPGPNGEPPAAESPAKAEAPKPVFRTLRSLRGDKKAQKRKVLPVGPEAEQLARRREADLKKLIESAERAVPPNEPERWLATEEEGDVLECRFPASLPPTGPPINFERFREKWNGQILTVDEDSALIEVTPKKKFWKRLLGRPTSLFVEVRWSRPRPPAIGIPGVIMRIRLPNKADKSGVASLRELGPKLVESLRSQLQSGSERRREKRVIWVQPVSATFLLSNGDTSGTVEGQSRDLTGSGMGFYLPRILPGTQVSLRLTDPSIEPITVVGKFVRVQRCGDGWYEVGVRFE